MQLSIRKIGNSSGIILPKAMLFKGGFDKLVDIEQVDDLIILKPIKINARSKWEAQFKEAFNSGILPEKDIFEGMENEFDKTEW